MKNNSETGIRWSTKVEYVDIETGEQLTEKDAKRKYIITKKDRYATINKNRTKGIITFTKQCRRNPQSEINFD